MDILLYILECFVISYNIIALIFFVCLGLWAHVNEEFDFLEVLEGAVKWPRYVWAWCTNV